MFISDILIDQAPNANPDSADQNGQRYRGIDKVIDIHMCQTFVKFLFTNKPNVRQYEKSLFTFF